MEIKVSSDELNVAPTKSQPCGVNVVGKREG